MNMKPAVIWKLHKGVTKTPCVDSENRVISLSFFAALTTSVVSDLEVMVWMTLTAISQFYLKKFSLRIFSQRIFKTTSEWTDMPPKEGIRDIPSLSNADVIDEINMTNCERRRW